MAAPDWQKLKTDAQDTLNAIDTDKLTKTSFQLLGACVAVLDHSEGNSSPPTIAPATEPHSTAEGAPELHSGVLDDFSVILSRYANSRSMSDRDAMRAELKRQLSAIEKELVEMRLEVHDPEAVQMFIDFRENLRMKL